MKKMISSKTLYISFISISLVLSIPPRSIASDLGTYWLGFGAGVSSTLCSMQKEGLLSNNDIAEFMKGVKIGLSKSIYKSKIDMEMFENGISYSKKGFPSCSI
tara:strand:- start:134 stop:442 length:309 start_codon:yes stop_codon:yes gene_type:complete